MAQILPLVFEQAKIADLRTACRMMQVSKAFKAAMSCCEPCLKVQLVVMSWEQLKRIAEFTFWLQRSSHLIKNVILDYGTPEPGPWRTAQSMLSFAFSSAASTGKPLRMQAAVIAHGEFSPEMLSSLPPSILTALTVPNVTISQLQHPSVVSSMQQLTALQVLKLSVVEAREPDVVDEDGGMVPKLVPAGFLSSLQGLNSLRTVALTGFNCAWPSLQCLPPSIQELDIFTASGRCLLDIPQLTSLQKLDVSAAMGIAEGSALPPSVPVVTFSKTPLPAEPCQLLAGVQQLECNWRDVQPADVLVQLSALRSLTRLSLVYNTLQSAAAAAPAWHRLQQLRSLGIGYRSYGYFRLDTAEHCHVVLEGIGKAQSLTSLDVTLPDSILLVPSGKTIAQLRNLEQLALMQKTADRQDMLHLRALTQLTELKLYFTDMDDATAAAVLLQLTNLRSLKLRQWPARAIEPQVLMSDAVLPAIAQLKGLRDLTLGLRGVNENSLPLLEGLTQLTRLGVGLCQQSLEHLGRVLRCKVCGPSQ